MDEIINLINPNASQIQAQGGGCAVWAIKVIEQLVVEKPLFRYI